MLYCRREVDQKDLVYALTSASQEFKNKMSTNIRAITYFPKTCFFLRYF